MVGNADGSTLVVGLDAATWRVIDPLLEAGKLPTIADLIDNGTRGTLRSTTPPMTPLAWTTIATGTNPGKHGIYDFVRQDDETYQIRPTEYSRIGRPTIWDVFRTENRPVGVVNYPMVSPPEVVDEFFISGFPTPDDSVLAYPDEVGQLLDERGYRIHPSTEPSDGPEVYFEDVLELSETQCETTIELLERYDVELAASVFMGIDWIQHYLWNKTIEGENAVERFYREIDRLLGELVAAIDDDWTICLVSDHGARPIDEEIHLNTLLAEWGYLEPREPSPSLSDRIKDSVLTGAYEVGRRLPGSVKRRLRTHAEETVLNRMREAAGLNQLDMHTQIDWERTQAFAYGYMGRVFLNERSQYPSGTVDKEEYEALRTELIERFESLTHPETGEAIVDRAIRGEELYTGPCSSEAPDLLLVPEEWRYLMYGDFGDEWIQPPGDRAADHHPDGVFVAAGTDATVAELNVDVADIAPTLLGLHDLPLIEGMDGSPLQPVVGSGDAKQETRPPAAFRDGNPEASEASEVAEDRLENLGYL